VTVCVQWRLHIKWQIFLFRLLGWLLTPEIRLKNTWVGAKVTPSWSPDAARQFDAKAEVGSFRKLGNFEINSEEVHVLCAMGAKLHIEMRERGALHSRYSIHLHSLGVPSPVWGQNPAPTLHHYLYSHTLRTTKSAVSPPTSALGSKLRRRPAVRWVTQWCTVLWGGDNDRGIWWTVFEIERGLQESTSRIVESH
jgi:hypothetical protein